METGDDQRTADKGSRYGSKGASNSGAHLPSAAPEQAELTELLGRSVLEARTQRICRAYGLVPRSGGLSRCYLARSAGLELAADSSGVVTTVFLHFDGDDGFTPYHGEIPGGGGSVPRRAGLWAALGRPDQSGEPRQDPLLGDYGPWDRWLLPDYRLHAQYTLDGQNLGRITYTLPGESRVA
jgi:hypothetical protein